jgi:signal transduction histidine kinase
MVYHPIQQVGTYLLGAMALMAMAGYAWQYHKLPAARYWVLSLLLRAVFLVALVMVTVSPALEDKILWAKLQQMCALAVIPTFLCFTVHFAEHNTRLVKHATLVLITFCGFGILSLLTFGWHDLYWRGVIWDGVTFGIVRGPIYWFFAALGYMQFLVVCGLCITWAFRFNGLRRWQIAVLPVDPMISLIGHVLWIMDQRTNGIPVLPLAFMLSGMFWSWIFFRLRVLDVAQLAQDTVTWNMNDSLIIIDDQDYILKLNPSAYKLLSGQNAELVGQRTAALAPWPPLAELACDQAARTGEISLSGRYYLFRVTPLTGWGNKGIGKTIVLQDISELKKAQMQLAEQQKALSIATERDRLRRELHDGSGQIWGYLKLQYQHMRKLLAEKHFTKVDDGLQKLAVLSEKFHSDVRESLAGLKNSTGLGFVEALTEFMRWYKNTYGIDTCLTDAANVTARFTPIVELQLLRIIQEAMTNIRKHASASKVQVSFFMADGQAMVVIEDDGRGFASNDLGIAENHYGLSIMKERVGEIQGRLEIDSAPTAGTRVKVWLPLCEGGRKHEVTVGG